jgi:hypothetical protein
MFRKMSAAVAVLALLCAVPLVAGALSSRTTGPACACCGDACACDTCTCDAAGCDCDSGGQCACTTACHSAGCPHCDGN